MYIHDIISIYVYASCLQNHFNTTFFKGSPPMKPQHPLRFSKPLVSQPCRPNDKCFKLCERNEVPMKDGDSIEGYVLTIR